LEYADIAIFFTKVLPLNSITVGLGRERAKRKCGNDREKIECVLAIG
jgi:hypothetical protein